MKKYYGFELRPPASGSRQFVTGPSKLDNEDPHNSVETANNF
jgi:hypothetical protein